MFCWGFFTVEAGGGESENGALRVGNFARQRGLRGSSLFTGMKWGGRDFAGRQVFPILWYKGAAACAYYSLKRR